MSLENLSQEELEEKFEMFIFNMSDYLEQIIEIAKEKNINLDYSMESLPFLEEYLIKNKITINDIDYDSASAYLGQVLRKNYGGKWICNLDKENNSLYYGYPVITGHTKYDVLFSPFHVIKAFLLRHKNNLLTTAIESDISPTEIDWSKFPTEEEPKPDKPKGDWSVFD
jgi:hypothetical protein